METEVKIPARDAMLDGNLTVPPGARGIVLFVHGSGSSRHSKRNRFVARTLNVAGLATLMSAKQNKKTLEESRMDRTNATDMPKPASSLFSADLSRFQSRLPFFGDDFCTARAKAFMETSEEISLNLLSATGEAASNACVGRCKFMRSPPRQ